jgi:Protein of unknown function (DUF3365)
VSHRAGGAEYRAKFFAVVVLAAAACAAVGNPAAFAQAPDSQEDALIAQSLAEMLRDARAIISNNQERINDPELGDKGLSGEVVLDEAVKLYREHTKTDPRAIDPSSRHGRLLRAMMVSITEVTDANQPTINAKGVGFKAFIPAVFGRLVNEAFARHAAGEAEIKVTAPPELVRNRKARPDDFEDNVIKTKLLKSDWPHGQPYSVTTEANGRPAYRVMVPEYYAESCLSCHGSPKGAMDVTGYPKEGAAKDDLGGVISITLYH